MRFIYTQILPHTRLVCMLAFLRWRRPDLSTLSILQEQQMEPDAAGETLLKPPPQSRAGCPEISPNP